jgi:hypothetical protein
MSDSITRCEEIREAENPAINPTHYTNHPSGVECKDIVKHMTWAVGTAVAYLWRCDDKHPDPIEDLEKAIRSIEFEIERVQEMKK